LLRDGLEPLCAVPCPRCAGLAVKLPASESMSKIFGELERMPIVYAPAGSIDMRR
jgi:hypothetical protein